MNKDNVAETTIKSNTENNQENNDKISIIVPVYNVEKYLEKCVDSLVNQSYSNLEIILVDDGATDSSGNMCDELAIKDDRIKVIHKVNGGLSDARNAGLEVATGDYIAFLDSDDYVHKDLYKDVHSLMVENQCDLGICNYEYVDEEGKNFYPISDTLKDEVLTKDEALDKLMEKHNFYYVTAWNKLYKKEVLKDIRFPKGKVHEDEFVAHHVLASINKVVTTSKVYIYYVQRQGSIMNTKFSVKRLHNAWAFYDRYRFFMEMGKKENALYALRQSYSVVMACIEGLDLKEEPEKEDSNKKQVKEIVKVLAKAWGLNPRTLKLWMKYLLKS